MDIREITDFSLLNGKKRTHHCTWPQCGKSFTRKSDLKRHYRIHTNEKPYQCNYIGCGKRFVQKSALTVHLRTHSGEKPHCCKVPNCGKRFSDSSSLARHRHTHSGKRAYVCSFDGCYKQFCTKSACNSHYRTHMQENTKASLSSASPTPSTSASTLVSSAPPDLRPIARLCVAENPGARLHYVVYNGSSSPTPSLTSTISTNWQASPSPTPFLATPELPPIHEYLSVLSDAASLRLPLPTSTSSDYSKPSLKSGSYPPPSSLCRFAPY